MKKTKAFISNNMKMQIRKVKEYYGKIVKQEVALRKEEYDAFVYRVESTKSWTYTEPVGLAEIKLFLTKCVPKSYLEEYLNDLEKQLKEDSEYLRNSVYVYVQMIEKTGKEFFHYHGVDIDESKLMTVEGFYATFNVAAKEDYISQGRFDVEFVNNVYSFINDRNTTAIFIYYYLVYDHGYFKLARLLSKIMLSEESGHAHLDTFRILVTSLMGISTSFGTEDKKSWSEFADKIAEENEELWKEIVSTLRYIIDNKGQKKSEEKPLVEMLIGDKEELLMGIQQFLSENKEAITLAYLLLALERTYHIDCPSFSTFCKAVNLHFDMKIGFRKGLDRYNDIKKMPALLKDPEGKSWIKAKEIIDTWAEIFSNCA